MVVSRIFRTFIWRWSQSDLMPRGSRERRGPVAISYSSSVWFASDYRPQVSAWSRLASMPTCHLERHDHAGPPAELLHDALQERSPRKPAARSCKAPAMPTGRGEITWWRCSSATVAATAVVCASMKSWFMSLLRSIDSLPIDDDTGHKV